MTLLKLRTEQQRQLFLIASGVSTAGSFAGITAKGFAGEFEKDAFVFGLGAG